MRKIRHIKSQVIPTKLIIVADIILICLLAVILLPFNPLNKMPAKTNPKILNTDVESAVAKCKELPDWRNCYGYKLAEYLKKDDLEYSIEVLNRVEDVDPKTQNCHIIAHKLAAAEMEKDPEKWGEIVKRVDQSFCNYGFIHGVIEARARFESEFEVNPKSIEEICSIISKSSRIRGADQSCGHIMGHVILADKEGDIAKSIEVCGKIKQKLQYQCKSGIFMENFTRDNLVAHGSGEFVPWDEKTIKSQEEICLSQKESTSASACWYETSHLYNDKYQFQPEKVYQECQKAPTELYRKECYMHSVQTLAEKPNASAQYLLSLCEPFIDNGHYYECEGVIIGGYIGSSLRRVGRTFDYCSTVPEKFKSYCYQKIGSLLGMHVDKKEVAKYCSKSPSEYQKRCNSPSKNI